MSETRSRPEEPSVAVALRYVPGEDSAPRVVASGHGPIADRIIELARAHDIAVREDAATAELLADIGLGEQIPPAAFAVVAEILFHILRANGQLPQRLERTP